MIFSSVYIRSFSLSTGVGSKALLCLLCMLIPVLSFAQFVTNGIAIKRADRCFMVTPSQNNVYGAVWSTSKVDLSQPQSFEFEIYLGDKDGAEGLAFLFHADPRGNNATGSSGGSLGFGMGPDGDRSNIISPSVGIELDTWNNTDAPGDIDADHTTVVYNGETHTPEFTPVPINPDGGNVEDNQCHTYSIEWNPATQELKLFFDGSLRFTHRDNIINKVFNGNTSVYYGFTGATGSDGRNEQSVSFIDPDSRPVAVNDKARTYPGRSVSVSVLDNDSHTAGISVSVSRIISVEGSGYASVSSNGTHVTYTPSSLTEGVFTVVYEIVEDIPLSCCPKTTTAEIEIDVKCAYYPIPFTISPGGPVALCEGKAVNLSVPFHRDATFVWRRNGEVTEGIGHVLVVTEPGEYSIEVTTMCGKQTSENSVTVVVNPVPTAPEAEDVLQCGFGTATLTATGGNDGEYRWYGMPENAPPIPDATNGVFVTPELDTDTTFYVSIVRNGCESERVPVEVTMREAPPIPAFTRIVIEEGESAQLESAEGPYTYQWSPAEGLSSTTIANPVATPSKTTTYTVKVTSPSGCVVTAEVRVVIREEIVVPDAFSPNGDGINDTWRIPTLEGYPGVVLEVFDRWGTKVYEKVDYYNEWNGTYNGKQLPKGAYLYVITLADGSKITGTVNIIY